jgi:glycine/D-amino acid oxidase-like deaminating enzyme
VTTSNTITVANTATGNPGINGWSAILEPLAPPAVCETDDVADWIVVGGGFAGLAAARRLTELRPGERVVVIEAHRISETAAGRSSGFMIDLPHDLNADSYAGAIASDQAQTAMNRSALAFSSRAAEEFGMGREIFDPRGKMHVAATGKGERHNRDYFEHLRAMGEPARWLDTDEVVDIFGTTYYRSGLFTPGTIMLQPAAYLRALAQGIRASATIYENSPVVSMERSSGMWTVRTPRGSVRAPKVILAVNGHLESFGFYRRRLMHVFLYASMSRPLTTSEATSLGGRDEWEAVPADPMGSTVRRIASAQGPRILTRNVFRFQSSIEASEQTVTRAAAHHDRSFRARYPRLGDVAMDYRWGGRLCLSFNGVQVFGEINDGAYAACCCNGLGASKGTLVGMLAAEHATGLRSAHIGSYLAQARPRRIPPDPFSFVGANVYLRWKEHRAGAEK